MNSLKKFALIIYVSIIGCGDEDNFPIGEQAVYFIDIFSENRRCSNHPDNPLPTKLSPQTLPNTLCLELQLQLQLFLFSNFAFSNFENWYKSNVNYSYIFLYKQGVEMI